MGHLTITAKATAAATAIAGLLLLGACHKASYKSVEAAEFARAIADTNTVTVDVRTAQEYAAGHIGDALNIDVLQDSFAHVIGNILPAGKDIAVYCRSGRRSKQAAEILARQGYSVIELNTGYNGWVEYSKSK